VKIKDIRIGQCVRHPEYDGTGDVTRIEPKQVEVFFNHGKIILGEAEVAKLIPLDTVDTNHIDIQDLISRTVLATLQNTQAGEESVEMAKKFRNGQLILQPADSSLASKDLELEVFFHKIVMVRDNLRVLEQKINSHKGLSELDKVELQQYITRIAGSLTTFNCLFSDKARNFSK
jgi:hypothetical protein